MNIEALRKKIGTLMGSSNWYLLDQDRINQFAVVTQDEQFIHTDPEKAAKTPFGTTIAHGFLTLALLPAMGGDVIPKLDGHLMSVNYGFEKYAFYHLFLQAHGCVVISPYPRWTCVNQGRSPCYGKSA